MRPIELQDQEFRQFQSLMQTIAGIHLSVDKKNLVVSRLSKRLRHYGLVNFSQYLAYVKKPEQAPELQTMVDLLTTNETYFFREAAHFQLLANIAREQPQSVQPFRVWSAACSSGQEPYSIAMILADILSERPWQVLASDISSKVLAKAKQGLYPLEQAQNIAPEYLKRFCLKGVGTQQGQFLVGPELRAQVQFFAANLNHSLPDVGVFDVIFLRNVMIYFNLETKQKVITRLLYQLKPGGYLIVGHSESLNGVSTALKAIRPSVYRKG